ncbi:MAG: hypothetical protein ACI8R4_002473, partial [Paracoccaceae bacterium]
KAAENALNLHPVVIQDLARPTDSEREQLANRCEIANFALYSCADSSIGDTPGFPALGSFADAFGLRIAETHRSAEATGIVALQTSQAAGKRGYIPYTPRALNWHTDGYYNDANHQVSAFVLHCIRPAPVGGVNQLLDPEIAYIRLRDENPAFIRALMHPRAMTIPPDGSQRPASIGPVFYADPATGRLQMRYTARTRSIEWRDDPATAQAQGFLRDTLMAGDPLMLQKQMQAGQGVLNNNVLHNRTSFEDGQDFTDTRLMIRVRFHNRIIGNI